MHSWSAKVFKTAIFSPFAIFGPRRKKTTKPIAGNKIGCAITIKWYAEFHHVRVRGSDLRIYYSVGGSLSSEILFWFHAVVLGTHVMHHLTRTSMKICFGGFRLHTFPQRGVASKVPHFWVEKWGHRLEHFLKCLGQIVNGSHYVW